MKIVPTTHSGKSSLYSVCLYVCACENECVSVGGGGVCGKSIPQPTAAILQYLAYMCMYVYVCV